MAVIKFSQEFKVRVSCKRIFQAMVVEPATALPKIIKSFVVLHGDGGVGTIVRTNFYDDSPLPFPYLTHRIDAIDIENCTTKHTMIEGGVLGDKIESIEFDMKFMESGDEGCVINVTYEYHTKGDATLNDEEIQKEKYEDKAIYIAIEEYLIANPNVCA